MSVSDQGWLVVPRLRTHPELGAQIQSGRAAVDRNAETHGIAPRQGDAAGGKAMSAICPQENLTVPLKTMENR